jgi:sugar phosphate permease
MVILWNKGLRWWIITLICLATVINYIDRTAFGIMCEMGKDLGMDEADYAIMLNIFMITYAAGKFYLENCTIWLELVWVLQYQLYCGL